MYSCDECDRGYASLSARSQHKKKKHTKTDPVNVKEKPAEDQVMTSFPLLDQQSTSVTTLEEASVPDTATKLEASSDDS
jgi:hypothetical protein